MSTLKQVLDQDYSTKNKEELVNLLKSINAIIGHQFEQVVAIKPSEFSGLKKDELVATLATLKEHYATSWESGLGNVDAAITSVLQKVSGLDTTFEAADAANANFAAELGSLEFDKLIGGPLDACVTAQANASVSTVNFIKEVGFDQDGNLIMIDFSHKKMVKNPYYQQDPADVPSGTNTTSEYINEDVSLKVPFVSVLNIPALRIETCTIDFNVKLNSVYTKDVSSKIGVSAGASGGWGPVKFNVSASYQRSSSTGVKVEKEYSMGVKVVATNDEMPAGLEKVLGIISQ